MNNKLLTPLELKVMNILWRLKKAAVKDILDHWSESPKLAYNTISTTIRILQDKGFVQHEAIGRSHYYYPAISKLEYQKRLLTNVLENAFSGSVASLMSALLDNDSVSSKEVDHIRKMIDNIQE